MICITMHKKWFKIFRAERNGNYKEKKSKDVKKNLSEINNNQFNKKIRKSVHYKNRLAIKLTLPCQARSCIKIKSAGFALYAK